jgi:hypothetical protein
VFLFLFCKKKYCCLLVRHGYVSNCEAMGGVSIWSGLVSFYGILCHLRLGYLIFAQSGVLYRGYKFSIIPNKWPKGDFQIGRIHSIGFRNRKLSYHIDRCTLVEFYVNVWNGFGWIWVVWSRVSYLKTINTTPHWRETQRWPFWFENEKLASITTK